MGKALIILIFPAWAFGAWSSDWDALEDYVNGVTNAVPQFSQSNLVYELQQAMVERALSMNPSTFSHGGGSFTNPTALTRFNTRETLDAVDAFISQNGDWFAPAEWLSSGQPSALMISNIEYVARASYTDETLISCPTNYNAGVTIPAFNAPGLVGRIQPASIDGEVLPWYAQAEGYGDELERWQWQYVSGGTTNISTYYGTMVGDFRGGLMGEAVYTITNVYESAGVRHYQVGWQYTDYDDFDRLMETNDWTGADALVHASLYLPTGSLPAVSFDITGDAMNTSDWWTAANRVPIDKPSEPYESTTTNTVSVSGVSGSTWDLPVFIDLSGITNTNTIDSTNLNEVAYLGAAVSVMWYGSRPSFAGRLDPANWKFNNAAGPASPFGVPVFVSVHELVARKWALQGMNYAIYPASFLATNEVQYTAGGYTNSYALAQAAYSASATNLISGAGKDRIYHVKRSKHQCSTGKYSIIGESKGSAPVATNLTSALTCDIYLIAGDWTGPTLDVIDPPYGANNGYTTYDNTHSNASRTNYYTIATATSVTASDHVFNVNATSMSGWPSTPGTAGDIYTVSGVAANRITTTARGHRGRIANSMLIDWAYTYE